jgi:hypothetical protein
LITKADAKIWAIISNPFPDEIPEPCLLKLTGTVSERSHSGNNQSAACSGIIQTMDKLAVPPCVLNGTFHTPEVATAIID